MIRVLIYIRIYFTSKKQTSADLIGIFWGGHIFIDIKIHFVYFNFFSLKTPDLQFKIQSSV